MSEDTKAGQNSTTSSTTRVPRRSTLSVLRATGGVLKETLFVFTNIITAVGVVIVVLQLGGVVRPLPNVVNNMEPAGYAELTSQGLNVKEVWSHNNKFPPRMIVKTTPNSADGFYVIFKGNVWYFENGQFHNVQRFTVYVSSGPSKAKPSNVMPNVYGMPLLQAQQQLAAAGFTNTVVWYVCSGKPIAAGSVRQVVLANRYPDVPIVDVGGPTNAAEAVLPNQQLAIKVSTGQPC